MLMMGVLVLTLKKKPYASDNLNNTEALSIMASALTIYCGIFFILDLNTVDVSNSSADSSTETVGGMIYLNYNHLIVYLSNETKAIFFLIIITSHLLFLVYWTIENGKELNLYLLSKYSTCYLKVVLCGNQRKLE